MLVGRVDFHVGRPGGDVEKVAGVDEGLGFAVFAPADERFAFENIDDGFLFPMMMDAGARACFDEEGSAPEAGGDAVIVGDGGEAQGAWSLRCARVEVRGMYGC